MTAMTVGELRQKVEAYASDCWDAIAKSDEMSVQYNPAQGGNYLLGFPDRTAEGLFPGTAQNFQVAMNNLSRSHLAGRLDFPPISWLFDPTHCPPEMALSIMNQLAKLRDPMDLMVRVKGETARAVLSSTYTKFDHLTYVDLIQQALSTMGDVRVEVHRAEIGDHLRAYVMLPDISFGDAPQPGTNGVGIARPAGDPNGKLHPGLYISNDEVGGGKVKGVGGLYQSICANGVIWGWRSGETMSIRHRFISQAVLLPIVAEMIVTGLRMSEDAAKTFVHSQEVHIPPVNLKPLISEWVAKYGLSVDRADNWLTLTLAESASRGRSDDPRLFDAVNGATYYAQQLKSTDEREVMERLAGDLLATAFVREPIEER